MPGYRADRTEGRTPVKNFLMLIVAFVIVYVIWHMIVHLVLGVFHIALIVGMIALFCWLVSQVYKALTKQKIY